MDGISQPTAYWKVYEAHTQERRLYDGMATVVLAKATLMDARLAAAMAVEGAAWSLAPEGLPTAGLWTVYFTAASDTVDAEDWEVGLTVDGKRCSGVAEALDSTPLLMRLFPTWSTWDEPFRVVFGDCGEGRDVQMQLVSAAGAVEFGWWVQDGVSIQR